jgi:transformation/transcription domain-associated protein
MALLKTAFPLLALSMESIVEQILHKMKPSTDEDIYRLVVALLNDGIQQLSRDPNDSGQLSQATEVNLQRFAESMNPNHLKYKAAFEQDFITSKPNLSQLVNKFRLWRDGLEQLLDLRPKKQRLEKYSSYLVEFEFQKFDDIEVPGQYDLVIS